MVALCTPFENGEVSESKLKELVEFQIKNGTSAIVAVGTTGESPTLSHDEHKRVIEVAVEATAGRIPVIAGTGSNSTSEAVDLTKHAKEVGSDGALMVCPYYNKPTQAGMIAHFRKVADSVDIPIILYNIPGRCAVNLLPASIVELSKHPNIIGVKEATGNMDQSSEILAESDMIVLSGDDSLTLPLMAIGAKGVISVAANIVPKKVATLCRAALDGNFGEARKHHLGLYPLCRAMFLETNPIPVKAAMGMMGLCSPEVRLPLCEMTAANQEKLRAELKVLGLIS